MDLREGQFQMQAVREGQLQHGSIATHAMTCDSVFGKRVLTYWGNRGSLNYHQMNVFIVAMHGKLYIFGKRRISPFRKYIVFHGYFEGIHVAVT